MTQQCANCGKDVNVPPSKVARRHRAYCSFYCRKAARTFVYHCEQCKKPFRAFKSTEGRKRFCSVTCKNAAQRKPVPDKALRQFRKEQRTCVTCGKPFMAFPSRTTKHCSRACSGKSNIKRQTGKRRRSQAVQCEYCGKTTHKYASRVNNYEHTFCDAACFHAWDAIYKASPEMIARLSQRLRDGFGRPSALEDRIADWLGQHSLAFERQVLLKVYTVDFLIGSTYLEVQGCYWHGCVVCNKELTPRQRKHAARDKSLATYCRKRGIQLLTIWEHDITHNDFSALKSLLFA